MVKRLLVSESVLRPGASQGPGKTCGSTGMCAVMSPGLPSLLLFWMVRNFNSLLLTFVSNKQKEAEELTQQMLANVVCLYISYNISV